MSREIKFRAFQDNQMITSPISSNYGLSRFFGLIYEDAPIMQYTGLKDKNGVEIYEGDILQLHFHDAFSNENISCDEACTFIAKVVYYGCGFITELHDKIPIYFDEIWMDEGEYKVIGNIHENKELLKTKQDERT